MNFVPYSKIETENLGILLFTARCIAYIAALIFIIGCLLIIVNVVINLLPAAEINTDSGETYNASGGYGMALGGCVAIFTSLLVLGLSGIFAAIVNWDHRKSSVMQ